MQVNGLAESFLFQLPLAGAPQARTAASDVRKAADSPGEASAVSGDSLSTSGGKKERLPNELSQEEKRQVDKLKQRDREVRAHEQAHVQAGGQHVTGGPTYEFQRGPDGRQYAIGGEVQIDTSPVQGDPEATILKMQQVRAAALAPAEPSSQDRAVAASASRLESQARQDLAEVRRQEQQGLGEDDESASESNSTPNRDQSLASLTADSYRAGSFADRAPAPGDALRLVA